MQTDIFKGCMLAATAPCSPAALPHHAAAPMHDQARCPAAAWRLQVNTGCGVMCFAKELEQEVAALEAEAQWCVT